MKNSFLPKLKALFCVLIVSAFSMSLFGATITATSNGNWNTPSIWNSNSIPTAGDDVIIPTTVTIPTDASWECKSLTIGGNLYFNNSSTTNRLTVYGDLTNNGTIRFGNGGGEGMPVEIYGNFTQNSNIQAGNGNQNIPACHIIMKGSGGTVIKNENNSDVKQLFYLTIDMDSPTATVTLMSPITFVGGNERARLTVNQGKLDAQGQEIRYFKCGDLIINTGGSIASILTGDCNTLPPDIRFTNTNSGGDIKVDGANPIIPINNLITNDGNCRFPNNANATVCIFGTYNRQGGQMESNGTWIWGPASHYKHNGNLTGTQPPNNSTAYMINNSVNTSYKTPEIIAEAIEVCQYALDRAEVTATVVSCEQIDLSWAPVTGADTYRVLLVVDSDTTLIEEISTTTYPHTGLSSSTPYSYRVLAKGAAGVSLSKTVSETTLPSGNPNPNITVAERDYSSISLNLSPVASAISNTLSRYNTLEGWTPIAYNGTDTEYKDENVSDGTNYRYRLVSTFATDCPTEVIIDTKTLAYKYLPTSWGAGIDGTTGTTICLDKLLGYVDFNYNEEIPPASWNISQVEKHGLIGAGNQTLTIKSGINYTGTSDMTSGNSYTIVANPSSIKAGENNNVVNLQDMTNNPYEDGGFLLLKGGGSDAFSYRISGLRGDGSEKSRYSVRIKLHNPGKRIGNNSECESGNNIEVNIADNAGIAATRKYEYTSINENSCGGGSDVRTWNNGQISNAMKKYGDYAVFEGTVLLSGRDNFTINIKPLDNGKNAMTAIASIEVWGCLPTTVEARDAADNTIKTNFCVNSTVNITASGAGFGNLNAIEWYKGESLAAALPVGQPGSAIQVTAPMQAETSEKYWAVGENNIYDTIRIHSQFCCSAIGDLNVVFKEDFSEYTDFIACGNGDYGPYASFGNATTLTGEALTGYMHASQRGDCKVEDKYYGIVTNARHGHEAFSQLTSRTSEKGMFVLNADDATANYFYQIDLLGVCPGTAYELSVWYADVSPTQVIDIGIILEVWEVDAANTRTLIKSSEPLNSGYPRNADWHEGSLSFIAPDDGNQKNYMLRLRNYGIGGAGNDLIIDEIIVTKCVPTVYLVNPSQNTSALVECSNEELNLSVELDYDMIEAISGGYAVYAQLMSSPDKNAWTTVGNVIEQNGPGIIPFSSNEHADNGGNLVYYCVKLSADQDRATDGTTLNNNCYNDVITQFFNVTINNSISGSISYPSSNVCQNGAPVSPTKSNTIPDGGTYSAPSGLEIDATTGVITPALSQPGTYTVTYTVQSLLLCEYSKSTQITIAAVPELTKISDPAPVTVCANGTVDITNSVTTDCPACLSYWTNQQATQPLTNPEAVNLSGTYYVKAVLNGCTTDTESIVVSITESGYPQLIDVTAACAAGNIPQITNIIVQNGTEPYSYSFDGGDTYQTNLQLPKTVDFGVENNIIVKDAAECLSGTISVLLEQPETPGLYPSGNVELDESDDNVTLHAASWENIYEWKKNDEILANETNNFYTFLVGNNIGRTAVYSVRTQNEDKCFSEPASVKITVFKSYSSFITPFDQNGINDVFATGYSITIFNRLGKLVYDSKDNKDGWDGADNNGKPVEPGVYFYVIKSEERVIRGSIEIAKK